MMTNYQLEEYLTKLYQWSKTIPEWDHDEKMRTEGRIEALERVLVGWNGASM